MESNGKPNCIHISQETADILIRMGKSFWLEKRSDPIQVKGKGTLQTYFFSIKDYTAPSTYSGTGRSSTERDVDDGEAKDVPPVSVPPAAAGMVTATPEANDLEEEQYDANDMHELENWTNL